MKTNPTAWSILWISLCIYSASSFPADDEYQSDDEPRQPNILPEIITAPTTNILSRDESVTLNCEVKNKDSDGALVWNLNNFTVLFVDGNCYAGPLCGHFQLDPKNNASLLVKRLVDNIAGDYYCQFRNVNIKHRVYIKAEVESVIGPKSIEFGDDLHLTCRVSGSPTPEVIWSRQANETAPKITLGTTPNLTVPHVNSAHSGIYTCTALNYDSQPASSRSLQITVVKGIAAQNSIVNAGESPSQKVDLCCIYGQTKKEAQIKWLKNGKDVSDPRHQIVPSKTRSCLTISTVKEEDLGTYTCQFSKDLGSIVPSDAKSPTFAQIDLIGIPSTPVLESVTNDESKTPVLKWKVKTFSPLTSYEIRVKKQEQSEKEWMTAVKKTVSSDSREETIAESLESVENGVYDVELVVENKFGVARLFSNSAVVVDRAGRPMVIAGSAQHVSPGGASRSIRISILCILLGVVLSRL